MLLYYSEFIPLIQPFGLTFVALPTSLLAINLFKVMAEYSRDKSHSYDKRRYLVDRR
jgi:hypothetical protein